MSQPLVWSSSDSDNDTIACAQEPNSLSSPPASQATVVEQSLVQNPSLDSLSSQGNGKWPNATFAARMSSNNDCSDFEMEASVAKLLT